MQTQAVHARRSRASHSRVAPDRSGRTRRHHRRRHVVVRVLMMLQLVRLVHPLGELAVCVRIERACVPPRGTRECILLVLAAVAVVGVVRPVFCPFEIEQAGRARG